jgi:hypothetical protein
LRYGKLGVVESRIHHITTEARKRLQGLLDSAQSLSLSRYELIDTLGRLERELLGSQEKDTAEEVAGDEIAEPESSASDPLSVLRRLEAVHARMDELARSMRWIAVLEQVAVLRYVPISQLSPPSCPE